MTHKTGYDQFPRWKISGDTLAVLNGPDEIRIPTADEIYQVAVESKSVEGFPSDGEDLSALNFSQYPLSVEIHISAGKNHDISSLCLKMYAVSENTRIPIADPLNRKADHFVSEGTWWPLISGSLEQIRNFLSSLSITDPEHITLRQYLELKKANTVGITIIDDSKGAAEAGSQKATEDLALPPEFKGTLYPYQRDGVRWLNFISAEGLGGILADEMGLGKTIQIIALLVKEKQENKGQALIISPSTLLENWRREIAKFSAGLNVHIHKGQERTGFPDELRGHDVIVTSYDLIIRDTSLFRQIDWNIIVLDEAQAIKNPEAKRTKAVKSLRRNIGLAVTGTPIENRLTDIWSITDYAISGYLGEQRVFEKVYEDNQHGAAALEPLISSIMLRRRVRDVARDLPERIDVPQALEMSAGEIAEYENVRKRTLEEYPENASLVSLIRLREFCTHPFVLSKESGDPLQYSTKYQRLTELLEEIFLQNEKALIFSSFTTMADILTSDIRQRFSVYTNFIDGRTEQDERQKIVDEFSNLQAPAALVLNPRAAGTGLNITAANHVIHYNLEWNPAMEDQASARAYRRGQTLPVTVHRLFYTGTVEEVIDQRLSRKRVLAETAVIGTSGTEDDIADIRKALTMTPAGRATNV